MNWIYITYASAGIIAIGTLLQLYAAAQDSKQSQTELSEKIAARDSTIQNLIATNIDLQNKNSELQDKNVKVLEQGQGINRGNTELINQNTNLLSKQESFLKSIAEYQDELRQKNQRITQLEEEVGRTKRDNLQFYTMNGSTVIKNGASTIVTASKLGGVFKHMRDLLNQDENEKLILQCDSQIASTPGWLTPYLFKGIALINLRQMDEGIKLLEYVESNAPGDQEYIGTLIDIYIKIGRPAKAKELGKSLNILK